MAKEDEKLLEILQQQGFISPKELLSCVSYQNQKMEQEGEKPSAAEALAKLGILPAEEIDRVRRVLEEDNIPDTPEQLKGLGGVFKDDRETPRIAKAKLDLGPPAAKPKFKLKSDWQANPNETDTFSNWDLLEEVEERTDEALGPPRPSLRKEELEEEEQPEEIFSEEEEFSELEEVASRQIAKKSLLKGYVIWLVLGIFGGHHYYFQRPRTALLYSFTLGVAGVGWLLDFFLLPFYNKKELFSGEFQELDELPRQEVKLKGLRRGWNTLVSLGLLLVLPILVTALSLFLGQPVLIVVYLLHSLALFLAFYSQEQEEPFVDLEFIPFFMFFLRQLDRLERFYQNHSSYRIIPYLGYFLWAPWRIFSGKAFRQESYLHLQIFIPSFLLLSVAGGWNLAIGALTFNAQLVSLLLLVVLALAFSTTTTVAVIHLQLNKKLKTGQVAGQGNLLLGCVGIVLCLLPLGIPYLTSYRYQYAHLGLEKKLQAPEWSYKLAVLLEEFFEHRERPDWHQKANLRQFLGGVLSQREMELLHLHEYRLARNHVQWISYQGRPLIVADSFSIYSRWRNLGEDLKNIPHLLPSPDFRQLPVISFASLWAEEKDVLQQKLVHDLAE